MCITFALDEALPRNLRIPPKSHLTMHFPESAMTPPRYHGAFFMFVFESLLTGNFRKSVLGDFLVVYRRIPWRRIAAVIVFGSFFGEVFGMQIAYVAHATFFLTLADGRRIVLDPYKSAEFRGRFNYPIYSPECEFAVVTHEHIDHCWTGDLRGNPVVVRQAWGDERLKISSVFVYHDKVKGTKFGGYVLMKIIEADGVRICHMGDIGEILTPEHLARIGHCDVAIVPVGGYYTIDAHDAAENMRLLNPKTVIPCHYRTPLCTLPIAGVEPFLAHYAHYAHFKHGSYEVSQLPEGVVLLDDAFRNGL